MPTFCTFTASKVATPLTTATEVVPARVAPLPATSSRDTLPVARLATLPRESSTDTRTAARLTPATEDSAGCWVKLRLVGTPGRTRNGADFTTGSAPAEKAST